VIKFLCYSRTRERRLKTKTKINISSRTAQQQGDETFLKCKNKSFHDFRRKDENEVDKFGLKSCHYLNCAGQIYPNFFYNGDTGTMTTLDRFGRKEELQQIIHHS